MSSRFKGKVVLVTGAGRGIGFEVAKLFASNGAIVVVNDVPQTILPNSNSQIPGGNAILAAEKINSAGGNARAIECDVSDFEETKQMVERIIDEFGGVHVLINNAGFLTMGLPWEITEKQWDEGINVCLKGTWNCTRHVLEPMKDNGWGCIVNCSSISALGTAEAPVYGAAKAGIVGLTNCIAIDMHEYNVTCNAIFPQAHQTIAEREAEDQELFYSRLKKGQISQHDYDHVRKRPHPKAVAPFICYLATDKGHNINGGLFFVRGGKIASYPKPNPNRQMLKMENPDDGVWTLDELIKRGHELQ